MVSTVRRNEGPLVEVYDVETAKLVENYEVRETRPSHKTSVLPSDTTEVKLSKAAMIADLAASRTGSTSIASDMVSTPSVLTLMVGQSYSTLPKEDEMRSSMSMSLPEARTPSGAGSPGWMVTAGEDRVVRFWDLARPAEGLVICGSPKEKDVVFK
jgi:phosphoinositide-3-kinase regulatory subunit 4